MNSTAADLHSFEISNIATFEDGPGGLVRLNITTVLANAQIYLHGAHVAQFQPTGAPALLFMSGSSLFAPGKAIRGGVPVIFPWFGGRAGHPESPAHGFARTLPWKLESLSNSADQTVEVVLLLTANDATRAQWPHEFTLRHRIRVGARLSMTLEVENTSGEPFQFEEALHTYFTVADVQHVGVTGLAGTTFVDKVDGMQRKEQDAAPIRLTGETDRVYVNTDTTCIVEDPGLHRNIVVEKTGSASTIVWNPWIAKAKSMADFGNDEWPGMICIETANAGENAVTLPPGATHTMTATVGLR